MTTQTAYKTLEVGTKVYYTGDMANCEGYGNVTAKYEATKYTPKCVDILMDDARIWRKVLFLSFDNSPGRRFWTADEYHADRQRRLELMQESMRAMAAKSAKAAKSG